MNKFYREAARMLLEKNLSELLYEEAILCESHGNRQEILLHSGHVYAFIGDLSIWGHWLIKPKSIQRNDSLATCPLQLLIDAKSELQVTDIVLANLIEETSNGLVSDAELRKNRSTWSAERIALLNFNEQQAYFEGHPKAIANKGRMGWGVSEHKSYAPEHSPSIQLRWLATQSDLLQSGYQKDWSPIKLLANSVSTAQLQAVSELLAEPVDSWSFIPVHPWQWEHKIKTLFAKELANGALVDLGYLGDNFLPQQSLRTLANRRAEENLDIKLPLTVLNTSCFRGIPARYIRIGAELSAWLKGICVNDSELSNTYVLQEVAGVHLPQNLYRQLGEAPYRYNELLGAIWREPVAKYLEHGQQAVMLGALWQTDNAGTPLLNTWLEQSGLGLDDWLGELFRAMVVPLYHLLCHHGIGLVAHGQNITLVLEQGRVVAMALKDFQGDLRLDEKHYKSRDGLSSNALEAIDTLPPEYLIHDLQTGNFVTALRFLSGLCFTRFKFSEVEFYSLLAKELRAYQCRESSSQEQHQRFNLFSNDIAKLCINRVRLQQGYEDSAERPIPIRGSDIKNPLFLAEQVNVDKAVQENVA